ncbi:hypothetical protein HCU74_08170 [Spongiibacter sp. KMU-166]|uniref:Uncharacterized protein n=1 Tax=Spongiibacter thalassae TaxID=2721624 RepID=A0ABX1GDX9_9GAMM|nr:hypothetical protein [Spongiibacter thalassae]NKI17390.1 hypothetical protein [Spongiibacter thalassae]
MEPKDLEKELAEAYKSLDKADRQIKNLLIERKQNQMVLELLETAGFISEGKLQEAREFVQTFKT